MPLFDRIECIERISVRSQWVGFADPRFRSEDLEVVRQHDRFVVQGRTWRTNRNPDPSARVGDANTDVPPPAALGGLLRAIEKPPVQQPEPENVGVDLSCVRPLAQDFVASRDSHDRDLRRAREVGFSLATLVELLSEPDALRASLVSYYRSHWTDDSPELSVRLKLVDGGEICL